MELKLLRSMDLFHRDLKTHSCSFSMGTRIRIDSVMRLRSSSRGRNISASVTVTVTVKLFPSVFASHILWKFVPNCVLV